MSVFSGPKHSNNVTKGHAHNDCFSFDLNFDGNDVFANRGTLTYADLRKRNEARSAYSHNVCIIDEHEINLFNEEQPFNLEYKIKPNINIYENNNKSLKVCCTHQGFKNVGVINYNRSFLYEYSNNTCLIVDSIEANGYHNIEWYFHIPQEKVFLSNDMVIIETGEAKYFIKSENKFDNISLKQELFWPEYGMAIKGSLLCYRVNDYIQNNNYKFKIGSNK